jgi:hypothetical protein
MAVIFPKHGEESSVARTLLAMADDVQDVRTNTDNGLVFVVPDYLYERYVNGGIGEEEEAEPAVSEEVQRRRPGRPRKVVPPKEGD